MKEQLLQDLKEAMKNKDTLMKDVTDFSTKMYQAAGAAQGAENAGAETSSNESITFASLLVIA